MYFKTSLNIMSRLVSFKYNITKEKNSQDNKNKHTTKPSHKTYSVWGTRWSWFWSSFQQIGSKCHINQWSKRRIWERSSSIPTTGGDSQKFLKNRKRSLKTLLKKCSPWRDKRHLGYIRDKSTEHTLYYTMLNKFQKAKKL